MFYSFLFFLREFANIYLTVETIELFERRTFSFDIFQILLEDKGLLEMVDQLTGGLLVFVHICCWLAASFLGKTRRKSVSLITSMINRLH